ncbi:MULTISPECIES: ATP-grasp domain-containing protein [Pontibacillus]|uniref:ATP-grasp domain-containing protein n=1 Tax=Pontibacillus chungwhensis TaxID=265426 RepID=A0ABY8V1E6_9BACI|nr:MULTISPECIES: ATP-grasp domain-containing protein [Pontibacillus]WIF99767.1 ATP-grasp domain-containing protein [Pontibacillus chungwhensis]
MISFGFTNELEKEKMKMNMISFQPYRTIGLPGITYIKPEHTFKEADKIKDADLILFPEKWQLPMIVHAWNKAIFPSYETIVLGHNKVDMTRAIQAAFPHAFPYTEIHANTDEKAQEIIETFGFPFVGKEPRNSMGNGVYLITDLESFHHYRAQTDTLYVQEWLETDREIRVCMVGTTITASYWKVAEHGQFHHNIARGGHIEYDAIPKEVIELVKQVCHTFNINYAGFDVLLIEGRPYILEFNVLFGNQGLTQSGIEPEREMYRYLTSTFLKPSPTLPSGDKHIS